MTQTLSTARIAGYSAMGQITMGKATGGGTTTVVDSTAANKSSDDAWKDGAMFIVRDAGGAGAAPEGQFQRISIFTNSTGTWTVDTAFSTAVAAGDIYGYTSQEWPLRDMVEKVNDALRDLGDLDLVDTTTLDTAEVDTEYAAAVAWKRARPQRVDIQGSTADAQDNQWRNQVDFDWVPAGPGSTGLIVFPEAIVSGRDIRVWYRGRHPALLDYDDVIHETLDDELVVQAVTVKALEWQNTRYRGSDEFLLQRLNDARQQLANLKVERPRWRVKRKPGLLVVGPNDPAENQFTYPV